MVKLTPALKEYAGTLGVAADATETEIRKALAEAVRTKKLSGDDFTKMAKDVPAPTPVPAPVKTKGLSAKEVEKIVADALAKSKPAPAPAPAPAADDRRQPISAAKLFAANSPTAIRVKGAADKYARTKSALRYPEYIQVPGSSVKTHHPKGGQPVKEGVPVGAVEGSCGERELSDPSQLDRAIAGAWVRYVGHMQAKARGCGDAFPLNDHDQDIVAYAMAEEKWGGMVGCLGHDDNGTEVRGKKLNEFTTKALLDDTTSGGIEVAPIAFDDAIVMIPLLFGQLFPLVEVVNVARGRRIKGGLLQNPQISWGTAEGTSIQPFNTSGMIAAFDTTIWPATGALETGLDWMEDSPVDIAGAVQAAYGNATLKEYDRVIAYGSGTNEPQGVFFATGTTSVSSENGVGGPTTVSDLEALYFGINKQWREEPGAAPVYLSNDTMYRRARSIPVGPGDERRVLGIETEADYKVMGRPWKIQNDIPNGRQCFFNPRRYRMYRRLGLNFRIVTEGRQLALNNTRLIVLRTRMGGQLQNGGAAAVMTDGEA